MGWEKKGGGGPGGHCLPWVQRNLSRLYSCSSPGPMDSAAQNARAEGVDTAAGQGASAPPCGPK